MARLRLRFLTGILTGSISGTLYLDGRVVELGSTIKGLAPTATTFDFRIRRASLLRACPKDAERRPMSGVALISGAPGF